MPKIEKHIETSISKTGREYRELHEWLDGDPEKKAERHDITRMPEYSRMIEEKYGKEGLDEYIRHIRDDVRAKFDHLREDFEKSLSDTLEYFGVKREE